MRARNKRLLKAISISLAIMSMLCTSMKIAVIAKNKVVVPTVKVIVYEPVQMEQSHLEVKETVEEIVVEPELISLGEFRLTAYCSCEICCGKWAKYNKTKSGTTPEQGRTIAVYEDQIPLGSMVIIDGVEYIAEDTGSAIKENCIDVYHNNHDDAKEFGVQYKEVFVRR